MQCHPSQLHLRRPSPHSVKVKVKDTVPPRATAPPNNIRSNLRKQHFPRLPHRCGWLRPVLGSPQQRKKRKVRLRLLPSQSCSLWTARRRIPVRLPCPPSRRRRLQPPPSLRRRCSTLRTFRFRCSLRRRLPPPPPLCRPQRPQSLSRRRTLLRLALRLALRPARHRVPPPSHTSTRPTETTTCSSIRRLRSLSSLTQTPPPPSPAQPGASPRPALHIWTRCRSLRPPPSLQMLLHRQQQEPWTVVSLTP
mmetsp:Transcript_12237/g.31038  ORF Transcript_12237/g.31038 Transcript_12237/m.31038 type:complete len:250 (-) Transcript_12237:2471-3220(-)